MIWRNGCAGVVAARTLMLRLREQSSDASRRVGGWFSTTFEAEVTERHSGLTARERASV